MPKIFLIQACRGSRDNDICAIRLSQKSPEMESEGERDSFGLHMLGSILRESWYIEAYSTPKYYAAYRVGFYRFPMHLVGQAHDPSS